MGTIFKVIKNREYFPEQNELNKLQRAVFCITYICENIREIWLYGSRSRGDFRENSDYDIYFVYDGFENKSYKDKIPIYLSKSNILGHVRAVNEDKHRLGIQRGFDSNFNMQILNHEGVLLYAKNENIRKMAREAFPYSREWNIFREDLMISNLHP